MTRSRHEPLAKVQGRESLFWPNQWQPFPSIFQINITIICSSMLLIHFVRYFGKRERFLPPGAYAFVTSSIHVHLDSVSKGLFTWRWWTPERWGNMWRVTPPYKVIKLKWEIIWTGGLPHLSGLPRLPGVPHLHVNRPLTKHDKTSNNWHYSGPRSVYCRSIALLRRCVALWNISIYNEDFHTYSIQ